MSAKLGFASAALVMPLMWQRHTMQRNCTAPRTLSSSLMHLVQNVCAQGERMRGWLSPSVLVKHSVQTPHSSWLRGAGEAPDGEEAGAAMRVMQSAAMQQHVGLRGSLCSADSEGAPLHSPTSSPFSSFVLRPIPRLDTFFCRLNLTYTVVSFKLKENRLFPFEFVVV